MNSKTNRYHRYRFPPETISHAVWLYHRFCLSFRDIEKLLSERGIVVTYESVRQWCRKFGPQYARNLGRLVTDKLRSYGAAHLSIMPSVDHDTRRYSKRCGRLMNRASATADCLDSRRAALS